MKGLKKTKIHLKQVLNQRGTKLKLFRVNNYQLIAQLEISEP